MHPELVAISNVWHVDVRVDALRAEHEQLVSATNTAIQVHKAAIVARDSARSALDALKTAERANNRELEGYAQKRDTTKRMLDDGSAPDYGAAERQLANCRAKVDELETIGLELLDRVDGAAAELAAADKALSESILTEAEARRALGARDAPLRVELTAALAEREAAWKHVAADHHVPYAELRRRKRPVLVNFQDGTCAVCHMRVAPQKANETQLNKAVHTCVGCGGYLLPGT